MDVRKRAAADPATPCKRSRASIGSTEEYDEQVSYLGKGGFAVVAKARHRATGRTVAIKFPTSPDQQPRNDAELEREARFLAACGGNPHVVGFEGLVRNHTTDGGDLCLVMEFVAARSLGAFLRERRCGPPLPESKVRAFMWKLLTGTKMMHDRHVVHRDLKPDNILIDGEDGELVKICDLGLAISMSSSPPYDQSGTLAYMAPEMLLQKPDYDALVDTWSLGCVMAEMLTGKILFDDDDDRTCPEFSDLGDMVQLSVIFDVLGTPDDRTWPEFTSLPFTAEARPMLQPEQKHSRLRDMFPEEKLTEQGFEVLQGLLTCNPDKRLTAAKALKHPWFAAPRPSAADAKVHQALPLLRKKTPRFVIPHDVRKAQCV